MYILIKDPEAAIGVEDFEKFKKEMKKRSPSLDEVQHYIAKGVFVISGNDVADYVNHLNGVSLSPLYKYALKLKNGGRATSLQYDKEFIYLAEMLVNYEGNKKKFIKDRGLNIPEWYCLLYLADGRERKAVTIYEKTFRYATNASRPQIIFAMRKLVHMGYVTKFGKFRGVMYKITSLGRSEIREIIKKYIIV